MRILKDWGVRYVLINSLGYDDFDGDLLPAIESLGNLRWVHTFDEIHVYEVVS